MWKENQMDFCLPNDFIKKKTVFIWIEMFNLFLFVRLSTYGS